MAGVVVGWGVEVGAGGDVRGNGDLSPMFFVFRV